jgi:hypothetical protein
LGIDAHGRPPRKIVVLHAPIVHRNVYRRNRMIQKKIGPLIHMMHGGEKRIASQRLKRPVRSLMMTSIKSILHHYRRSGNQLEIEG